jgi:hypothetical protein
VSVAGLVDQARRLPAYVWVAGAGLGLFWLTRPRPSSAVDGGTVMGSEDIQAMSDAGAYNPMGAHATGLPYELGHLCPVTWTGRTKSYPTHSSGVVAMMAIPDPADDDGYPWLSYGPQRGPI